MSTQMLPRAVILVLFALPATGSVFQLELKPASRVEAGRVTVHAGMLNRGDEDMLNMRAAVRFEDATNAGPFLTVLRPGESSAVDLDAGPIPAIRGRHTAMVTARYTDRYGHPFMTIAPIPVYSAEPPDKPALSATLSRVTLDSGAPLALTLTSLVKDALDVRCRLMLPDELRSEHAEQLLQIPGHGTSQVTFAVANAWATPDSQYRVYAVVDTIRNARNESLAAPGLVTIPARRTLAPETIKRLWLIPAGLLLAFLLAQCLPRRALQQ